MTQKVLCQYPIHSSNNIFFGCVTAKEDDNALYLDKITRDKTNINAESILLNALDTDTPLYWLPGVAIEERDKLQEFVTKQGKLPSDYTYVGGITTNANKRIKDTLRNIDNSQIMVDLPYTLNEDDIAENRARLFPGIGRKEYEKIEGELVLTAIQLKIPNTYQYTLDYIDSLGVELE